MGPFKTIWDVKPDTAHPRARQLLSGSIVWDFGDEDSPLGNDTGADTFAAYLNFRAVDKPGRLDRFISDQLGVLGVADADWDLVDEGRLQEQLRKNRGFSVIMRDDFIIGLAFAQLLLEGKVDSDVRSRAITALRRQATDVVLSFRGGGREKARREQLAGFRQVLESA